MTKEPFEVLTIPARDHELDNAIDAFAEMEAAGMLDDGIRELIAASHNLLLWMIADGVSCRGAQQVAMALQRVTRAGRGL